MPAHRKPAGLRAVHGSQTTVPPIVADLHDDPEPPEHLPGPAREEWLRICSALAKYPRWLARTDRAVLAAYCVAWHVHREATADIAHRGVMVPGRSSADRARGEDGLVLNVAVAEARRAADQLRQLGRELGLTPWARDRLQVAQSPATSQGEDLLTGARPEWSA